MHTDTKRKTVDVIIPTHKPGHIFYEMLKRLDAQDVRPDHVMVINTGEEYWDPQFEQLYPGLIVRHIRKSEFDHGGTRHRMALASEADLILFMTQDALPADRHLIEYLAAKFDAGEEDGNKPGSTEDGAGPGNTETGSAAGMTDSEAAGSGKENVRVAAAFARQLPRLDCSTLESHIRAYNYPPKGRIKTKADLETLGIKTFFCSNVCAMYDREIYMEQGGFPPHTIFNEDMIFAHKLIDAGYGIAYVTETRVVHSHDYTARQQFHRNFDVAVSQADHPEVFRDTPSEGEGFRMVRTVAVDLIKAGRPQLIFSLGWQSACKYAGYFLGKHYRMLPKWLSRKCSLNQNYWK